MLSSALVEMINRCECFFFIDTENSTYNENSNDLDAMTFSPWIKLEIDTARVITRRHPERMKKIHESKEYRTTDSASIPQFLYPLSMKHLVKLEANKFASWVNRSSVTNGLNHPLTELYVHGE